MTLELLLPDPNKMLPPLPCAVHVLQMVEQKSIHIGKNNPPPQTLLENVK